MVIRILYIRARFRSLWWWDNSTQVCYGIFYENASNTRAVTSDCCGLDQCGDLCLGYHDHMVILELRDSGVEHRDAGMQKLEAGFFVLRINDRWGLAIAGWCRVGCCMLVARFKIGWRAQVKNIC